MNRSRPLLVAAAALTLAPLLSGCSSARTATSATPGDGARAQAVQVWAQLVGCMRTHGYPSWPDAVVDADGRGSFPDVAGLDEKSAIAALQPVCGAILDQLPAAARPTAQVVTTAQLATLRAFAACLRQHGIPRWPDPNADGGFPLRPAETQLVGTNGIPADCRAVYAGAIAVDPS